MTARDALDRLNRKLAAGGRAGPRQPLAPPLDHPAGGALERLERIVVPPGDEALSVCDLWPGCGCNRNCDDAVPESLPRWVWPAWFALLALCLVAAWLASSWSM